MSLSHDRNIPTYLLRWLVLFPAVAVMYLLAWGVPTVIGIPFLQREIIADSPGTYEITSHFLWDWIVHPLALLSIGAIAAEASIKAAHFVAPLHKLQAMRIISGMLVLLALVNVAMFFGVSPSQPLSAAVKCLSYNISLGVCSVYFVLSGQSKKSNEPNAA